MVLLPIIGLTVPGFGLQSWTRCRGGVRHGVLAEPNSPGGSFPLPVLVSEPRRRNGNAGQVA